jgi:hypothetical protein
LWLRLQLIIQLYKDQRREDSGDLFL